MRRVSVYALATVPRVTAFLLGGESSGTVLALAGGTGAARPTVLRARAGTAEYAFHFEIV